MAIELSIDQNDPPIAALLAVEAVKPKLEVRVSESDKTLLNITKAVSTNRQTSIARFVARSAPHAKLCGLSALLDAQIDHWLSYASITIPSTNDAQEVVLYLESALAPVTYLVGDALSLADIFVWAVLKTYPEILKLAGQHVTRYFNFLTSLPPFQAVINKYKVVPREMKGVLVKKERRQEGKFIELPGAEVGKVVVRFPPEASGYLHIGHAKAALLNQHYQQQYEGELIMRFDDTNPEKENAHFEEVILGDLELLGLKPDRFTHTSDHFDTLLSLCTGMLKSGHAYVDDTDPEVMKKEREERVESKNRNNSAARNLEMWDEMQRGTEGGMRCCVRVRMDMSRDNGCLRDPTIYRCKKEPHVRTGTKYNVYPTYDFACPIVDSLEGVTHALRTMEYHDRDEQYYWILDILKMRKPIIWEYSRLNLQNTVMSKRKLTWIADEGLVDGWADPRFPTVRGVMRRGMTVEGLKEFVIAQGSSRSTTMMDWDKIWSFNKKVIDPVAARYTALQREEVVVVEVEGVATSSAMVAKHPKDPAIGEKEVWFGARVLIEGADAAELKVNEVVTFINWGNLIIKAIEKGSDGKVTGVKAQLNLENKDYKKTQKLTWLADVQEAPLIRVQCVTFDHIISKAVLGKEEDFKLYINKDSKVVTEMLGDPCLEGLKKGDIIQLQRRGFFICDQSYHTISKHSGVEQPLVLFNVPDGHSKEMPTSGSKHKSKEAVVEENKAPSKKQQKKQQQAAASSSAPPPSSSAPPASSAPPPPSSSAPPASSSSPQAVALDHSISQQGDKVRDLKAKKASKAELDGEVKKLLALKADFKQATGQEWKPGVVQASSSAPPPASSSAPAPSSSSSSSSSQAVALDHSISQQGDKVRDLKAKKASKADLEGEVKKLLALKADFKQATGQDWKPGVVQASSSAPPPLAPSSSAPTKQAAASGKQQKQQQSVAKQQQPPVAKQQPASCGSSVDGVGSKEVKKVTRLGLEAKKADNFSEWYSQVITKAEMIEYYNVSGCYVLRPWAYGIWEEISKWFDGEIKKIGFRNCYFPMFVSQAALQTEKEHIADFAPEVAWVTRSGETELAEPIAIRPTSETVMYPSYANWVQSHRDLPIKLNQWCNVVRWEFKHPQPFLRTREFLWQEGHSAHAIKKDAEDEVLYILELYSQVYHDLLAIPVVKGRKTEKEKFAGADYTTTIEAYVAASGRAIQAATSHHLGQNFAKMFDISFEHPDTREKEWAYQNSWGLTTRSIGVVIMIHGDDKGLVLPPRIAPVQVVVVPCGITAQLSQTDRDKLDHVCKQVTDVLSKADVRVEYDGRDNYSPGWKFNHWELKGVPLRVEVGPKDVKAGEMVVVRRVDGDKRVLKVEGCEAHVKEMLKQVHELMLQKAQKQLDDNTVICTTFDDFCHSLDQNKIIMAPYCGAVECEENIKKLSAREPVEEGAPAMGAKGLCIPFKQPSAILPSHSCINPGCKQTPKHFTLFGKSY